MAFKMLQNHGIIPDDLKYDPSAREQDAELMQHLLTDGSDNSSNNSFDDEPPPRRGNKKNVCLNVADECRAKDKSKCPFHGVKSDYKKAVDSSVLSLIDEVNKNGPAGLEPVIIATVDAVHADKIRELTGIDCTGYEVTIDGDAIRHIEIRHGKNGEADQSMSDPEDVARIGWVAENFDDAELSKKKSRKYKNKDNSPASIVILKKRINGYYYVTEAVSDAKTKRIYIVGGYKNEK